LAARARAARYAALGATCAGEGIVHLLLGHHAADQAETLAMRRLGGSGPDGRAAMPAIAETAQGRLLRPLLAIPKARLRTTLRAAGLGWVEDPSNADPATLRARLRTDPDGTAAATGAALAEAAAAGAARAWAERSRAAALARRVQFHPEGYALLTPGVIPPAALAAVLRAIGGADWAPAPAQVAPLAACPQAATLGGVRLLPAGRLSPGDWLVVREAAAIAPPIPARAGATWDGRFRIAAAPDPAEGLSVGALGAAAARLRHVTALPSAVLRTLPALWRNGMLVAVPVLRYSIQSWSGICHLQFAPPSPACGAPFAPPAIDAWAPR
ncbi:MAG TPA: tRNA lysidine(34) synthetase, partial [Acetobacteraceae bacterium]|nr:tRNA lysidine(34) synthetase [Acetobacteraceae bacterium]